MTTAGNSSASCGFLGRDHTAARVVFSVWGSACHSGWHSSLLCWGAGCCAFALVLLLARGRASEAKDAPPDSWRQSILLNVLRQLALQCAQRLPVQSVVKQLLC